MDTISEYREEIVRLTEALCGPGTDCHVLEKVTLRGTAAATATTPVTDSDCVPAPTTATITNYAPATNTATAADIATVHATNPAIVIASFLTPAPVPPAFCSSVPTSTTSMNSFNPST